MYGTIISNTISTFSKWHINNMLWIGCCYLAAVGKTTPEDNRTKYYLIVTIYWRRTFEHCSSIPNEPTDCYVTVIVVGIDEKNNTFGDNYFREWLWAALAVDKHVSWCCALCGNDGTTSAVELGGKSRTLTFPQLEFLNTPMACSLYSLSRWSYWAWIRL